MIVSSVVFIECTRREIQSGLAFKTAATFTDWPVTVVIRCTDTGQGIQEHCTPPWSTAQDRDGQPCHGWQYFRDAWERAHGPILVAVQH